MSIPYRTRNRIKRFALVLLVLCIVAVVVGACWLIWLGRFVVYTRNDGAKLDFSMSNSQLKGEIVRKPIIENPISIYYNEGDQAISTGRQLEQMKGYYITREDLESNFEQVKAQVRILESGTPVMVDMKSIYGNFFYSSSVSDKRNEDLDIEAMDAFIKSLNSAGFYTIARVPALRDFHYGLENVQYGLPVAAGYLWMDDAGCYWLNPANDGTVSYLAQIANELKNLGFDEVVFCDFYVPTHPSIVFKGDRAQALHNAAQTLVNTCSTEGFAVSFTVTGSFDAPTGRSRFYLEDAIAADAQKLANQFEFEDPAVRVVFLTDIHDTRFDSFSVLRPIADAE